MLKKWGLFVLLCFLMLGSSVFGVSFAKAEEADNESGHHHLDKKADESVAFTKEADPPASDRALWYRQPAEDWETEALPIGNGYMGAMIFGGVRQGHIQFNEKTLWTGGPGEVDDYAGGNRDGAADHLDSVREKLANGDRSAAQEEAERYLTGENKGFGNYQNFGDIYLDFDLPKDVSVSDYRRELDLEDGIARVSYELDGVTYTREYFMSYPDHVMVMRLTASEPGKLTLDVTPESAHEGGNVTVDGNTMEMKGALPSNDMKYEAGFKVLPEGGDIKSEDDNISVSDADALTVVMSAGTNYANDYPTYRGDDPHEKVTHTVEKASQKSYKDLRTTHISDYQHLFNRVSLDLDSKTPKKPTDKLLKDNEDKQDNSLVELFFQYGRYLLIASSREGSLPANLQGVWNNENEPQWSSDYHFNINLEMNYWPAEVTNLSETVDPLINYVDKLREPGRMTAEKHYGITNGGWAVNTMNNPFGFTAPGWQFSWGWMPTGNAFISQNLWENYQFSGDKEKLREEIYPIIKEAAQFHADYLEEHEDGTLVSTPCISPEQGGIQVGCSFDQELIWELFTNVIDASKVLDVDAEFREELMEKRDQLSPIQVGSWGQIQEWKEDLDDPDNHHRHVSQLVALYPGKQISRETPDWMDAAEVSLNARGDGGTGWSKANKVVLWARLLDGDRSLKLLQEQLNGNTLTNLFDTHPPFQIDGNFGATAGISEMLLQSHLDTIDLLPALPSDWNKGSFQGLRARGAFTVDVDWDHGDINQVRLTSDQGNTAKLKNDLFQEPFTITDENNHEVDVEVDDDVVTFDTEPNETYVIQPQFQLDLDIVESAVAGDSTEFTGKVTNTTDETMTGGELKLDVPKGWEIQADDLELPAIAPGESEIVEGEIEIPVEAKAKDYTIKAEVKVNDHAIQVKQHIDVDAAVDIVEASSEPVSTEEGAAIAVQTTLRNNRSEQTEGDLHVEIPDGWELLSEDTHFMLNPESEATMTLDIAAPEDFQGTETLSISALVQDTAVSSKDVTALLGSIYISDLDWEKATNGWGPVEKDKSNGEEKEGDGNTLTLNGKKYEKGLGVHAPAEIVYQLDGKYDRFTSDVGVDDEQTDDAASIVFQVWGDGEKLYESDVMKSNSETQQIDVYLKGIDQLKLVVTDADDGNGSDHGDWADAMLHLDADENDASDIAVQMNDEELKEGASLADTESATFTWEAAEKEEAIDHIDATFDDEVYQEGDAIDLAGKPGEHELTLSVEDNEGNTTEQTYSIQVTTSVANIKTLVKRFDQNEKLDNNVAHALKMHLTAVEQYEKQGKSDKVKKHLTGFDQLLEHNWNKGKISKKVYRVLKEDTAYLLEG